MEHIDQLFVLSSAAELICRLDGPFVFTDADDFQNFKDCIVEAFSYTSQYDVPEILTGREYSQLTEQMETIGDGTDIPL